MMVGPMMVVMPVAVPAMVPASVAALAGTAFVQREFIADGDIEFAHYVFLVGAATNWPPSEDHHKVIKSQGYDSVSV